MGVTVDEENSFIDSLGNSAVLEYTFATPGRYTGQASLRCQPHLCQNCNRNQSLKIQELNYFTPLRESNYDVELKQHKCLLEDKYKLCISCQEVVGNHLKKQAGDLKTFLLNSHLQQSKSTPMKVFPVFTSSMSSILLLVNVLCVFLASLLLCSDSLAKSKIACGHTKRRYLLVAVMCLLLQLLIFLKRKTRAGVIALLCWTLLCVLSGWEVYWSHSTTKFRVVTTCLCWVLTAGYLLFSLHLYFGMLRKKKKKRIYIAPSKDCRMESSERDSQTEETTSKSHLSAESTAGELDYNLNAMSLGLPRERSKIQDSHLSAVNHETDPSHSETNLFSWEDEDSSDSMDVDNSIENHQKRSLSRKNDTARTQGCRTEENSTCRPGPHQSLLSSKLRIFAAIFSVRSFLLLTSLLLNLYLIVVYTEWLSRAHRLLSKVFRR